LNSSLVTNESKYAGGKIVPRPSRLCRTCDDGAVTSSIQALSVN